MASPESRIIEALKREVAGLNQVYNRNDLPLLVEEVISMARRRARDFHVDMNVLELLSTGMLKLHEVMVSERYRGLETPNIVKALRTAVLNAYNDKYSMSRGKARRHILESEWASRFSEEEGDDREHPDDPEQYAHHSVRASPEMRGEARLLQTVIKDVYSELDAYQTLVYNALLSGDYENPADIHRGLGLKYDYVMDTVRLLSEKVRRHLYKAKNESYYATPEPPGTACYRVHATLRSLALRGKRAVTLDDLQDASQRSFLQMTKLTEIQRELARYNRDVTHKRWRGAIELGKLKVKVIDAKGVESTVEKDAVYLLDPNAFMQVCGSQDQEAESKSTPSVHSGSSSQKAHVYQAPESTRHLQ
jgi:hypothetical protein